MPSPWITLRTQDEMGDPMAPVPAMVKARNMLKFGTPQPTTMGEWLQQKLYGQGGVPLYKSAWDSMVDTFVSTNPMEMMPMGTLYKTPKDIIKTLIKKAPKIKTAKELAKSADKLKHGTEVPFENFQKTVNRYPEGHPRRQETDKFYFTEDPKVASTFSFGSEPVILNGQWIKNIKDADASGQFLPLIVTEGGERIPINKLKEHIGKPVRVLDNAVSSPKVVDTNVYGHTLDLTDPKMIEDIKSRLRKSGADVDGHPLLNIQNWKDHEFNPLIPPYMRHLNIGKLKVPDAKISGGSSYLTLPEWIDYGANDLPTIKKRLGIKDKK